MAKGNATTGAPTLAQILERLENTRRLVQLSLHHQEQSLTETGEAVSSLKEIEAELDLIVRDSSKAGAK